MNYLNKKVSIIIIIILYVLHQIIKDLLNDSIIIYSTDVFITINVQRVIMFIIISGVMQLLYYPILKYICKVRANGVALYNLNLLSLIFYFTFNDEVLSYLFMIVAFCFLFWLYFIKGVKERNIELSSSNKDYLGVLYCKANLNKYIVIYIILNILFFITVVMS